MEMLSILVILVVTMNQSLWCTVTMYKFDLQTREVIFTAVNVQGRNFNFRVWFEHFKIVNCFRTSSPGIWRTDILWFYTSAYHVHYAVWSFNVKYGILEIMIEKRKGWISSFEVNPKVFQIIVLRSSGLISGEYCRQKRFLENVKMQRLGLIE